MVSRKHLMVSFGLVPAQVYFVSTGTHSLHFSRNVANRLCQDWP
ncbi:MAG TPA: hypothetical protein VI320_02395 [Terracidiphilus sp.]